MCDPVGIDCAIDGGVNDGQELRDEIAVQVHEVPNESHIAETHRIHYRKLQNIHKSIAV